MHLLYGLPQIETGFQTPVPELPEIKAYGPRALLCARSAPIAPKIPSGDSSVTTVLHGHSRLDTQGHQVFFSQVPFCLRSDFKAPSPALAVCALFNHGQLAHLERTVWRLTLNSYSICPLCVDTVTILHLLTSFIIDRFATLIAPNVTTKNAVRQPVSWNPMVDLASNNMRCNINAGVAKEVVELQAGTDLAFGLDNSIFHPGPGALYLGKVPESESAATWDGSGQNWFKANTPNVPK